MAKKKCRIIANHECHLQDGCMGKGNTCIGMVGRILWYAPSRRTAMVQFKDGDRCSMYVEDIEILEPEKAKEEDDEDWS